MRDWSEGSDFDIFLVPSRSDITRVAGPWISGSGCGKNASPKPRLRIDVAEIVVELLRDVARQLEMLLLVVADRHVRGAVDQDVGRHQVRIGEQPDRGVLAVLAGLLLELGHAVEPAQRATQLNTQASSACSATWLWLNTMCFFGSMPEAMKAAVTSRIALRQLGRVLPDGDGVQVDHAIDAVVALLQLDELA